MNEPLGLVELQLADVRLGQRLRRDGLEVLAAGRESHREALLHIGHRLGNRSPGDADRAPDHERVEVRVYVRFALLQLERPVDELLRACGVSRLAKDSVAQCRQRERLHQRVAGRLGLGANLLHLHRHGGQVAQPPDRACRVVAPPQRRIELHGADELPACRLVLLAR